MCELDCLAHHLAKQAGPLPGSINCLSLVPPYEGSEF